MMMAAGYVLKTAEGRGIRPKGNYSPCRKSEKVKEKMTSDEMVLQVDSSGWFLFMEMAKKSSICGDSGGSSVLFLMKKRRWLEAKII